jgi:hypothetical protein
MSQLEKNTFALLLLVFSVVSFWIGVITVNSWPLAVLSGANVIGCVWTILDLPWKWR